MLVPWDRPVKAAEEGADAASTSSIFGSTAQVVLPAGYGSSGGIALVTVPGRDDRMIVTEADCLNATCIFSLPYTEINCLSGHG